MDLPLRLNDLGAFAGKPMAEGFSLDALCTMFGVTAHDRHTAGGDAFITARIFQRLLRAAKAVGQDRLGWLCEPLLAAILSRSGARSRADSSAPDLRSYSTYLLDFPLDFAVFWGLAWCFALPERFALPVCTTVVSFPPVAFEAAPNAAPAAAPFATGWLLCCSSAGGGGGGGGACSAGGGCCAGWWCLR